MGFSDSYIRFFRRFLPNPFTIALGLTVLAFWAAFFLTRPESTEGGDYFLNVIGFWYDGVWQSGLLAFTVQMMLILVLGHALALSQPFNWLIGKSIGFIRSGAQAAALVAFLTLLVSWLNWGLGLIFGAVLARRVTAYSTEKGIPINYPLIAAAGYSGLMIWHGGLSGSAPLTVAGADHSLVGIIGQIGTEQTIFSGLNLAVTALLLAVIPGGLYLMAKRVPEGMPDIRQYQPQHLQLEKQEKVGVEKFESNPWVSKLIGLVMIMVFVYISFFRSGSFSLDLNSTNLALLALGLLLHKGIYSYLSAIDEAIKGAAGILIQFPLYFGILGILAGSGMIGLISGYLVENGSTGSLPILSFFSAGLVNVFVPSGGGQWAVQGPIIAETAKALDVSIGKMIMAFSYGDQWTNMLQPFWALPLLAITGLKAKDILPFTLFIMLLGALVFIPALLLG